MSGLSAGSAVSIAANCLILGLFVGSGVWVFFDTRKRGRPLSESFTWAIFMGLMLPLAIVIYIYFRRKKLI